MPHSCGACGSSSTFRGPTSKRARRSGAAACPTKSHALDDAAFRQLARKIDLTGGHIRQITLRAAFVAAAADKPIGLAHIAYAANAELAKLGMPPVELDLSEASEGGMNADAHPAGDQGAARSAWSSAGGGVRARSSSGRSTTRTRPARR